MSDSPKLQQRLLTSFRNMGRKLSFRGKDTPKKDDLQEGELTQTGKEKQAFDEPISVDLNVRGPGSLPPLPSTSKIGSEQPQHGYPRYVAVAGSSTPVQSEDNTEEKEEGNENERETTGMDGETNNKTPSLGPEDGNDSDKYYELSTSDPAAGGETNLYENLKPLSKERDDHQNKSYAALSDTESEGSYLDFFVFATCHPLQASSFLKITLVFLKSGCKEQQQEQKVGRMFGTQVHEGCYYLNAAHKEDVDVKVSGLSKGWKIDANDVVQVLRYKKLWDGKIGIAPFLFETLARFEPELFSASFKIQQDGLEKEATVFDIREPMNRFIPQPEVRLLPSYQDNDSASTFTVKSNESGEGSVQACSRT